MRRVHIEGVEYEYQIGKDGIGIRNSVTRKREHHKITDIHDACGGDVYPIMPRHVKFYLMRKLGVPTRLPWNLGDLVVAPWYSIVGSTQPMGRECRYLVISIDDEFVELFDIGQGIKQKEHITKLLPDLSTFTVIPG